MYTSPCDLPFSPSIIPLFYLIYYHWFPFPCSFLPLLVLFLLLLLLLLLRLLFPSLIPPLSSPPTSSSRVTGGINLPLSSFLPQIHLSFVLSRPPTAPSSHLSLLSILPFHFTVSLSHYSTLISLLSPHHPPLSIYSFFLPIHLIIPLILPFHSLISILNLLSSPPLSVYSFSTPSSLRHDCS